MMVPLNLLMSIFTAEDKNGYSISMMSKSSFFKLKGMDI